jgi:HEAT repeat protein
MSSWKTAWILGAALALLSPAQSGSMPGMSGSMPGMSEDLEALRAMARAQAMTQMPGTGSRAGSRAELAYQRGTKALDQREWERAVEEFRNASGEGSPRPDAAMYWTAYALNKLGRRDEALATIGNLRKQHPNSRWLNDAGALEVEVKQAAGRPVSPDSLDDEDVKLMALNGLMNSNPERALPILEKLLAGSQSPRVKERALFVLGQSNAPQARETVVKFAKGAGNPDLQRMAIRTLGIHGKSNGGLLSEIYQSQPEPAVRREVLRAFMVSGDSARLATVARAEKDASLKGEAIRLIGSCGDEKSLAELYVSESDPQIRREILTGFMAAGASAQLIEAANQEKDEAVRRRAIQMLGGMGKAKTGEALGQLYRKMSDLETRKTILRAYMSQGNATALIAAAKSESNPELKREAVRMLSVMNSKEATDYLMELLEK